MIIVPNYWGKGDTISEAWQQVKRESYGNLRELKSGPHTIHVVFDTDEVKSCLDEFGFNISYPAGHPPIKIESHRVT